MARKGYWESIQCGGWNRWKGSEQGLSRIQKWIANKEIRIGITEFRRWKTILLEPQSQNEQRNRPDIRRKKRIRKRKK